MIGPLGSGLLVEHLGFIVAFDTFAVIAMIAASLFVLWMPETRAEVESQPMTRGVLQPVSARKVAYER
jgi:hypothetical protein